jgi:hypothetical protein
MWPFKSAEPGSWSFKIKLSNYGDELKLIASAIREAAAVGISPQPDEDDEIAEPSKAGYSPECI